MKVVKKVIKLILFMAICFGIGVIIGRVGILIDLKRNMVDIDKYKQAIIKVDDVYEYHFETLTDREKRIYREMVAGVSEYRENFTISGIKLELDEVNNAYLAVIYDHPELFFYHNFSVKRDDFGATLYPEYSHTKKEAKELNEEMETVYKPIIDQAKTLGSDEEKIRYVHDSLIELVTYYYYENIDEIKGQDYQSFINTFTTKQVVCSGYTYAFKFIMDNLGIRTFSITDRENASEGEAHVWNAVYVNDSWKYIDLTWDDKRMEEGNDKYQYYLLDSSEFFKSHLIPIYVPEKDR